MNSSPAHDPVPSDDLSALSWVQDELRRSLEAAHKALRRFVKEAEALDGSDVDAVDPSVLRAARHQLHQGAGALELVGLPAAATLLRASEAALQRYANKPQKLTPLVVEQIEHASFALLDYLGRMLAGRPVSPLALFPQYRAVQEAAGADRIHPADLWPVDWQWRPVPADAQALPREPDARARGQLEQLLLVTMRGQAQRAAPAMSDLFAGLGRTATQPALLTLWPLAAAVFEAVGLGLLPADVYVKRLASRLLAQLRMVDGGQPEASERLAHDLLFFCAQAEPGAAQAAPRLRAAREAYGLQGVAVASYQQSELGRYDPAWLVQARKRVAGAKDAWSAVAAGELHRLPGLGEQFALVADSVRRLFPGSETLAQALTAALQRTQQSDVATPPALAMEVATSLLFLEASLDDGELDQAGVPARIQRLAERIQAVVAGQPQAPLEPWMEELYRRVSDRQTIGSVVQELRVSLSEAEKQIDLFFRNPADASVLLPVPGQLQTLRGVLSVLGMDHAAAALLRVRDDVDGLTDTQVDPERVRQAGVFDRLAANLGALGFLIDMVSVQPHMAKALFEFDADSGRLSPVMGRVGREPGHTGPVPLDPRLLAQVQLLAASARRDDVPVQQVASELERLSHEAEVADQPALAAAVAQARSAIGDTQGAHDAPAAAIARSQLTAALTDFISTASDAATLGAETGSRPAALLTTAKPLADLADDEEMRTIFLEEAQEVLQDGGQAHDALAADSNDRAALTTLRRAFHTLKGSARMVGLREFGEAAWACEQLFNARLAALQPADDGLLDFTRRALTELSDWVGDIAGRTAFARSAAGLQALALAAREPLLPPAGELPPAPFLPAPDAAAVAVDDLALGAPPLPEAAHTLPMPLSQDGDEPAWRPSAAAALPVAEALDFSLDLSTLDDAPLPDGLPPQAMPPRAPAEAPLLQLDGDDEVLAGSDLSEGVDLDFGLGLAEGFEPSVPPAPTDASPGGAFGAAVDPLDAPPADLSLPLQDEGVDLSLDIAAEPALPVAPAAPLDDPLALGLPEPADTLPEVREAGPSAFAAFDEVFSLAPDEAAAAPAEALPEEASPAQVAELPAAVLDADVDSDTALPAEAMAEAEAAAVEDEQFKVIGPLRIGIPLFNIYLNEADELSRRLMTELAEWSMELHRPVGETAIALAHSLAGSSATVGFADLSRLSRALEHALMRSDAMGAGEAGEAQLFVNAADEIRRLLHQFAAGFLREPRADLVAQLAEHEQQAALRFDAAAVSADADADADASVPADLPAAANDSAMALPLAQDPAVEAEAEDSAWGHDPAATGDAPLTPAGDTRFGGLGLAELQALPPLAEPVERALPGGPRAVSAHPLAEDEPIDLHDEIDAELFPIFDEECAELLPQLSDRLRAWAQHPGDRAKGSACMRVLHTLKGGARLAGAMVLGELAHRMESHVDALLAAEHPDPAAVEALQARADQLNQHVEALRRGPVDAAADVVLPAVRVRPDDTVAEAAEPAGDLDTEAPAVAEAAPRLAEGLLADGVPEAAQRPIDWSRFVAQQPALQAPAEAGGPGSSVQSAVRVRAPVLDRLVNQAGEVSIARARIESEVAQIRAALGDLSDNLERLRGQLRDIDLQAETQMSSRMDAAKAASQNFDPLEFDRFTRFQELTRMMTESVGDVATVQRAVQRSVQRAEDELAAQSRLTRDLQDDLLRTRMVEFDTLADRFYRVVRQAAKETGKQVRLDLVGGAIEVDRGVLDRMTGAFEHLLRNSVSHGIEPAAVREAAGKVAAGAISVTVSQAGNEVAVTFRDDGAGLDLAAIRRQAVASGLLAADAQATDAELAQLIFQPGFTTAERVTEIAGRGVGMDVVRAEVNAMGGRIETATSAGQGTSFTLLLPLTTAVTQVVLLRCGETVVAVPSTLIEGVRRAPADALAQAHAQGQFDLGEGEPLPFFWLGALLQSSPRSVEPGGGRTPQVVVVRSAQQRIVLHIDEVLGNHEVVVKNLGPQLARVPGLVGVTLLASGSVALIYNPVALAALYGAAAAAATRQALAAPLPDPGALAAEAAAAAGPVAPLVLVVDDSLTVRRVTQRLLEREGYRVVLAKDGLDALERLAEALPQVVLSDIEMPRMDGFDLVRNIRGDARLRALPVIMITSRIAQKHRDHAVQLGVNHYLGKPYAEEDLLALLGRYTGAAAEAPADGAA